MGRPRNQANSVATTERLLASAEHAFAASGYDATRLEDIARAAGISRPSLLYHWGTKHALYSAVVRDVFADLGRALERGLRGADAFPDRLDRVLGAFLDFVRTRPTAARLILREILDDRGTGHDLMLEGAIPILEMVERFIRIQGREHIPHGLPVRFALLQIVGSTFVRTASGALGEALWGDGDETIALARHVFLKESRW